jgi:type II secretory pathway pseudopilin PulG
MRNRLRKEDGWVLVVAMVAMALMLLIGLALLSTADTQSKQSRQQRERESAFNMAEAALGNEVYLISRKWPGSVDQAKPSCAQTSTDPNTCPVNAQLLANFAQSGVPQADYRTGVTWKTQVIDDGQVNCSGSGPGSYNLGDYYVDAASNPPGSSQTCSPLGYDQNKNNQVWVRAEGVVRGHTRVLVGRAQMQKINLPFPRIGVAAGRLTMSNNQNQFLDVDNTPIDLHCGTPGSTPPVTGCADFDPNQIQNYGGTTFGSSNTTHAMTDAERASLKTTAVSEGHYCADPTVASPDPPSSPGFCDGTGCPQSSTLDWIGNNTTHSPGWTVYVEGPTANCDYQGNSDWNASSTPGWLVFNKGSLSLGGTANFYGVIYMVNNTGTPGGSSATLFRLEGGGQIVGAVSVDGNGGIDVGNNANTRITYDPSIPERLTANGAAGIVQNTWRQIR